VMESHHLLTDRAKKPGSCYYLLPWAVVRLGELRWIS
jgi:hypothetical protein